MKRKFINVGYGIACIMSFVFISRKINILNNINKSQNKIEEVVYKDYKYNVDRALVKYKSSLKKSKKQKIRIYCIGESTTRGEYSSDEVNKSWVGVMKSSLQNKHGDAGEGFINIYEGALSSETKGRWTLGNGWSICGASNTIINSVGGFGGCYGTSNNNTSSSSLLFRGNAIELIYSKFINGGTADITINGKKVGSISCFADKQSFSNRIHYSGLSNSTHTLSVIPASSNNIYLEGAIASSGTKGIEVDKIAISSKRASYFNKDIQKESWNSMYLPELVLLSFGLNEAGNKFTVEEYKENMIGLVTYWKGRGSDVCLIPSPKPADSWTTNWASYVAALYEISDAYNTGIIDIYKAFYKDYTVAQQKGLFGLAKNDFSGSSGTNTAHPSDEGYKYIGDIISSILR